MAQGNITPAYGQWLKDNLTYYQFTSPEAKKLAKDLNDLDVGKMENNQYLISMYAEFVNMFCNSMHSVAFGINDKGISTKYMKAYLVENEYGVMAPIAFMEANNKQATYNLDGSAMPVIQEINKINSDIVNFRNQNADNIEKIEKFPVKKKPKLRYVIVSMLLLIATCFGILRNHNNITLDKDVYNIGYLWIVIAVILLIFVYKVIREVSVVYKWNQYKKNKKWLDEQVSAIDKNANDGSELITDYSAKVKEANKTNTQESPNQPITVAMYLSVMKKKNNAITKMSQKLFKSSRGIGMGLLIIMVLLCTFLFYGVDRWEYRNIKSLTTLKFNKGNNETTTETVEEVVTQIPTEYNSLLVVSSEATSELYGTKTGNTFVSDYTVDGDLSTCWQEGVDGDGLGEALTYHFDGIHPLVYIDVWNGRLDGKDKYYANNRIYQVEMICYNAGDEAFHDMIEFEDNYSKIPTSIYLTDESQPINCDSVKIIIRSVHKGTKYEDTCLTDIVFYEGVYQ